MACQNAKWQKQAKNLFETSEKTNNSMRQFTLNVYLCGNYNL